MAHKRLTASQQFEVDKIKRKSILTTIITSVTTLLIGGFIGAKIIHSKYEIYDNPEVQKFMDVYNIMVDEWLYGDEDYEDSLIDNAIDSLVNNDDPYTFYTTKDESQNLTMTQKGLGFRYIYYGGNYYINHVFDGSDAKEKGLKEGDVVVASKIDNEWKVLNELTYEQGRNAMLGKENTLCYRLSNGNEITFERSDFYYNGATIVNSEVIDGHLKVALKIDTFLDINLGSKVENLLKSCLETHNKSNIAQLTIDLRGNGGGYVDSAIDLASLFVNKGSTILKYRYKDGREDEFKTTSNKVFSIPKFYILQDSGSASASETFTVAMQDLAKPNSFDVKVIGTTSFGKGLVQSVKYYEDGSALRYTIAETVSPLGRCINKIGIAPDVDLRAYAYYFGEWGTMNEEAISNALFCLNFVLDGEYTSLNDAVLAFQNEYSLNTSGTLDVETSKLLQKLSYDKYLSIIYSYNYELI